MGIIIDMAMSTGLRRKRRISRSMIARTRPISTPPHHERAVLCGRGLKFIPQTAARIMNEDVVEGGALNGERFDADIGSGRRLHDRERGRGSVGGVESEDVIFAAHALHIG